MSAANPLKALVLEDEWPTRNYLVKLIEGTGRAEVTGAVAPRRCETCCWRARPACDAPDDSRSCTLRRSGGQVAPNPRPSGARRRSWSR
jgi:hypothetical protein